MTGIPSVDDQAHTVQQTTTPEGPMTTQQPNVAIRWVYVTPELACEWLQRNPVNRHPRPRIIDKYATDMGNGNWIAEAADPIRRTSNGDLLDGQHRLHAIIKSGESIWVLVADGVVAAAQAVMDTGTARMYSDQLRIQGRRNTNILSALLRWATLWDRGARVLHYGQTPPTHKDLEGALVAHPELEESARFAATATRLLRIPASAFGMAHWLFTAIDRDQAVWFLSRVADGTELTADHPAYAFRERSRRDRENNRKVPPYVHLALLIMAWNAYRDGRALTRLQLPSAGVNNGNYPTPR